MILFDTDKKPLTFLLQQIEHGQVALPDFQRSFVWDPNATRELVVSVLRSFPAGTLLLMMGGAEVFAPREVEGAPALRATPPYLVLDGQQRLTSLYQAFEGVGTHRYFLNLQELIDGEDLDEAVEVFTLKAARRWDDEHSQAEDLMLPLAQVRSFSSWRSRVQKIYAAVGEDIDKLEKTLIDIEDRFIKSYATYHFPVTTLSANTPLEAVCTIFETLNRTGVKLSAFELITARAFASKVHLRDMWDEARQQHPIIAEFDVDPYYVLQAIATIASRSSKRSAVLGLKVEEILEHWEGAILGLEGSLRLLRDECGVLSPKWLPYTPMLVTMTAAWPGVIAGKGPDVGARLGKLKNWFWCSVFTGAYENSPNSATERDVPELLGWFGGGEEPESVYTFEFNPKRWREITGRQRALYRATIALLMRDNPLDFHHGSAITAGVLASMGVDDHHVFPRAHLVRSKARHEPDSVLNHTLIDRLTNIVISDKAPSTYLAEMREALGGKLDRILTSHGLPCEVDGVLWRDDFEAFLDWREQHLATQLQEVTGLDLVNDRPVGAAKPQTSARGSLGEGGLPLRAMQLLDGRAPSEVIRSAVFQLLTEVAGMPDVVVRAGRSAKTDDGLGRAVQLHRLGSSYGAFAYVFPRGSVTLRLGSIDQGRFPNATIRNVRDRDPYKIRVALTNPDDVVEAIASVKVAYDAALS